MRSRLILAAVAGAAALAVAVPAYASEPTVTRPPCAEQTGQHTGENDDPTCETTPAPSSSAPTVEPSSSSATAEPTSSAPADPTTEPSSSSPTVDPSTSEPSETSSAPEPSSSAAPTVEPSSSSPTYVPGPAGSCVNRSHIVIGGKHYHCPPLKPPTRQLGFRPVFIDPQCGDTQPIPRVEIWNADIYPTTVTGPDGQTAPVASSVAESVWELSPGRNTVTQVVAGAPYRWTHVTVEPQCDPAAPAPRKAAAVPVAASSSTPVTVIPAAATGSGLAYTGTSTPVQLALVVSLIVLGLGAVTVASRFRGRRRH